MTSQKLRDLRDELGRKYVEQGMHENELILFRAGKAQEYFQNTFEKYGHFSEGFDAAIKAIAESEEMRQALLWLAYNSKIEAQFVRTALKQLLEQE